MEKLIKKLVCLAIILIGGALLMCIVNCTGQKQIPEITDAIEDAIEEKTT